MTMVLKLSIDFVLENLIKLSEIPVEWTLFSDHI